MYLTGIVKNLSETILFFAEQNIGAGPVEGHQGFEVAGVNSGEAQETEET